jgi:hypothetical protein
MELLLHEKMEMKEVAGLNRGDQQGRARKRALMGRSCGAPLL